MTPELAYFLKINVAIELINAYYRLFIHKYTYSLATDSFVMFFYHFLALPFTKY